jgi:hypothetical protein
VISRLTSGEDSSPGDQSLDRFDFAIKERDLPERGL